VAVGSDKFDEEKERERLRKMSDEELTRDGRAEIDKTLKF
jgi:hypothetical protein